MQELKKLHNPTLSRGAISPPLAILRLLEGEWIAHSIQVAVSLGLADLLLEGPKDIESLAESTDSHAPSLYRLLRSLASVGIFAEVEPNVFAQTELSDALRSDRPDSIYHMARLCGRDWHANMWKSLEYSVRTGKSALEHLYQQNIWEMLSKNPEEHEFFDLAMTSLSGIANTPIAQAYDFSSYSTVVDIGGGQGSLLTTILRAFPAVNGILFDQSSVIASARKHIPEELQQRMRLIEGDFFASVPSGGDIYLLKQVIHDWDDDVCIKILKNCRKAMKPGGRILIIDRVIQSDGGEEDISNKYWDLEMLVVVAGRQRTTEEFIHLYNASGFTLTRIISTKASIDIVEGVPSEER